MVAEDRGTGCAVCGSAELFWKTVSVKDVISKNKCGWSTGDEVFCDVKGLCKSFRAWLNCVLE